MKKILTCLILLGLLLTGIFIFNNNNSKKEKIAKIKVGEVAHSIFYAPQYVADSKGYFKEEGIDVDFILTAGVNKKRDSN